MKNPKTDPMDYDGMGDFSRYRTTDSDYVSLENTLRKWVKNAMSLEVTESKNKNKKTR